jgi:tripartite-type tricarboxylate transporter receptor subunit TctC
VWYGLVFPAGTPAPIVRKANAEVVKQLKSPEVSGRFAKVGVEPQTGTPGAFRDLIRTEVVTWAGVVKSANIKVE